MPECLSGKEKYDELYDLLTRPGGYVGSAAGNNNAMILGSGFQVRKANAPVTPLTPPIDVRAERTTHNGRIKVQWSPVTGSRSYVTEMTMTDPAMPGTVWQPVAYTSRAVATIDNLSQGQFYWFRVKAVGPRENSGFSDVALVMAA